MIATRFPVDVLMQRVPLVNRWISERWQPIAVLPAGEPSAGLEGSAGPAEVLDDGPDGTVWRFPGFVLDLHASEGEGYYLNLSAPEPCVFVLWRPAEEGTLPPFVPVLATVSYNEAARMLDAGEQVDRVPMTREIHAWLEPFMMAHYTPGPRKKIRRNDPFADERGRR
jgi:hypothetical protein